MEVPVTHGAVRLDQAVQRWRARRARDAGSIAEVVPYTGYGSTNWVRVLARVLLAKPPERRADVPAGARGWRNFIGVPVEVARVHIRIGGQSFEVQADRSGVIDVVVDVDLEPGWHQIGLSSEGSAVATALIFVVDPETTFGVLSDIDDTVMVTALRATHYSPPRCAADLLVDGSVERRADVDSLPVAQPVSGRCAALD